MWVGLIVIAIGSVLLLEQLGVIEGGLSKYWPVLADRVWSWSGLQRAQVQEVTLSHE